jgi:hypothetical protein
MQMAVHVPVEVVEHDRIRRRIAGAGVILDAERLRKCANSAPFETSISDIFGSLLTAFRATRLIVSRGG